MKRLVALTLVLSAGCDPVYLDLALDRYEYPALGTSCYATDSVDYFRESGTMCLSARTTGDARDTILTLMDAPADTLDGWDVLFRNDESFDIGGSPATGVAWIDENVIWIAEAPLDARVALLKHELLHATLWERRGVADYDHVSPEWGECGCWS